MRNQDVDKNVPDILSDTLTKTQKLKENDDHIHEDVEVDCAKGDDGVVNTYDHVETLCGDMISKDESLHVIYAIDSIIPQFCLGILNFHASNFILFYLK